MAKTIDNRFDDDNDAISKKTTGKVVIDIQPLRICARLNVITYPI